MNMFNLCCLGLGLTLFIGTIAAFFYRKSLYLLGLYIFLLVLLFFGQVIFSVLIILFKEKVSSWAYSKMPNSTASLNTVMDQLNAHVSSVAYAMLIFSVLIVSYSYSNTFVYSFQLRSLGPFTGTQCWSRHSRRLRNNCLKIEKRIYKYRWKKSTQRTKTKGFNMKKSFQN